MVVAVVVALVVDDVGPGDAADVGGGDDDVAVVAAVDDEVEPPTLSAGSTPVVAGAVVEMRERPGCRVQAHAPPCPRQDGRP